MASYWKNLYISYKKYHTRLHHSFWFPLLLKALKMCAYSNQTYTHTNRCVVPSPTWISRIPNQSTPSNFYAFNTQTNTLHVFFFKIYSHFFFSSMTYWWPHTKPYINAHTRVLVFLLYTNTHLFDSILFKVTRYINYLIPPAGFFWLSILNLNASPYTFFIIYSLCTV